MRISRDDINTMQQRYRAHFINCLSGFKSANLIGTADKNGNTNLAIVSSVIHLGANPPYVGMIIRPHTVPRGTLENILETGYYTINHVHEDIHIQAHQTSARYDEDISEFEEVGLQPEYSDAHTAPYVLESRLKMGVVFKEHKPIELNGTNFIIGEIIEVIVSDAAVGDDGFVDIESLQSVAVSGLDRYHKTTAMGRLSYAKPDSPPQKID